MDVKDLKSGKFDQALLGIIEGVSDVIVILTPGCLDRCRNEDDWFRREIRHAITCKRNIVPIIARGFKMPPSEALPADICGIASLNSLTPAHELFEASIDRLVSQACFAVLKSRQDRVTCSETGSCLHSSAFRHTEAERHLRTVVFPS